MKRLLAPFLMTLWVLTSCSEEDKSSLYDLEGTHWQVATYNETGVSTIEYVEFQKEGLLSLTQNETCYESDLLVLLIRDGKIYSNIDDIDSTVEVTYSITGDTLKMDFTAYRVGYVKTNIRPEDIAICN